MKLLWTALAILAALLVQTALSQVLPWQARILDPFLLVLVYCGLTGGETHGMLAGLLGGWVQDVHFGGTVIGLSGLTKVLVGFGVGLAGARFLLASPGARTLVLVGATLLDAFIFQRLAEAFDVKTVPLSMLGLVSRAAVNAMIGMLVFELIDRQQRREVRR